MFINLRFEIELIFKKYFFYIFPKDIPEDSLGHKIFQEEYRLPNPQSSFKERTDLFYNNVIQKCWPRCGVLRPTFSELKDILFNYFDNFEPDYDFPESFDKNHSNDNYEIKEESPDQVNLGLLIQSGNFSEIWKSKFVKKNKKISTKLKLY